MARLVAVCRDEEDYHFLARQIPLYIDDSLTVRRSLIKSLQFIRMPLLVHESVSQMHRTAGTRSLGAMLRYIKGESALARSGFFPPYLLFGQCFKVLLQTLCPNWRIWITERF